MPPIDPRLVGVFIWILGSFAFMLQILCHRGRLPRLRYAFLVALMVRLMPALILPRGARYEMEVFRRVAETTLDGQSVYLASIPHPHLPLQLYWFAAALWLNVRAGFSFTFWLKLPNILADVALMGLIYAAVQRKFSEEQALHHAWLYAVNPITTLVCAYQGQFDTTPLLLMLSACYLFESHGDKRWGFFLSSFVLGLGILSKTWPVMLLPIILLRLPDWRSRLEYMVLAGVVPALGVLFYELLFPGSLFSILRRSLHAGAIAGWWGYSSILNVLVELTGYGAGLYSVLVRIGKIAALFLGPLVILKTQHRSAFYSLLLTILVLFAAVPNLGLQGLSWIVPLAVILNKINELSWYVVGCMIHMVISYWGIHLTEGLYLVMSSTAASSIIQLSSLTAWGIIVVWCVQELLGIKFLPKTFTAGDPQLGQMNPA